jgi:hypothetical protein
MLHCSVLKGLSFTLSLSHSPRLSEVKQKQSFQSDVEQKVENKFPSRVKVSGKIRVARWYIFKPKIPIWVSGCVSSNGRC